MEQPMLLDAPGVRTGRVWHFGRRYSWPEDDDPLATRPIVLLTNGRYEVWLDPWTSQPTAYRDTLQEAVELVEWFIDYVAEARRK